MSNLHLNIASINGAIVPEDIKIGRKVTENLDPFNHINEPDNQPVSHLAY